MKALIIWDSYGVSAKICEVEKETDVRVLSRWNKPEKLYKIKETYLSCRTKEIDIESVLGQEHNYLDDSIGFTQLQESYICPITDKQAEVLIKTFKSEKEHQEEKISTFEKEVNDHKEAMQKKAIETGEPQVLSKRMENCNNDNEECNIDYVVEWIYPDGSIREKRTHTY